MNSAALDPVFSVPFRHLWSTNFSGEQSASEVRPLGLARFVGDQPNLLLKYLISENFNRDGEVNLDDGGLVCTDSQWPIVLFGPSGTGKTSLAMTVISDLADRFEIADDSAADMQLPSKSTHTLRPPNSKPIFVTALDFDRRYRSALETDSITDFRKRLIQSTGLVVDDLQRLADKPAAQTEFILVLDEMCRKNRPIVVTMDVSPQLCNGLSPQLVSRLTGGLSLPVNPPGPSARLEIIRDLARINQIQLTDDAAKLLVDRLHVTVPKLDHVFAQIKTSLRAKKEDPLQAIDAAKLTQIFKKSDNDLEELSQLIIKQVAAEFNLKVSELKSNSRKQSIVMARGVAIYLNRILLGTSFLKIGTYFGNRDHSTIMHAFRKIKNLVSSGNENVDAGSLKTAVQKLKQQLAEQFASQINFV
jgi:chromosomal replication initiator protein